MSDLDCLDENESLHDFRVNVSDRTRRTGRLLSISPNIMRAKVAREQPPKQPVKPAVTPDVPAPSQMSVPFARFIHEYQDLLDTFRERSEAMEIARLELDRVAGIPAGYSGKLLSKRFRKCFGLASLGPILQTLGLILIAVEDPAKRDKTLACRERFYASNRRVGNHCNPRKEKRHG